MASSMFIPRNPTSDQVADQTSKSASGVGAVGSVNGYPLLSGGGYILDGFIGVFIIHGEMTNHPYSLSSQDGTRDQSW